MINNNDAQQRWRCLSMMTTEYRFEEGHMKDRYHDNERLALGAVWTDDAYHWLARQLQCGAVVGTTVASNEQLETLRDGLMVLSETLNALAMPYPPPSMSPRPPLRVVK